MVSDAILAKLGCLEIKMSGIYSYCASDLDPKVTQSGVGSMNDLRLLTNIRLV